MASSAVASSTLRGSRTFSLPPQAGHIPYGNAKLLLTLPQSSQRHLSLAVPQQMYCSSPSIGWWHFGHFSVGASVPVAVALACAWEPPPAFIGSNFATSSVVSGHFLPNERYVAMDLAARRPAPIARIKIGRA